MLQSVPAPRGTYRTGTSGRTAVFMVDVTDILISHWKEIYGIAGGQMAITR